MSRGTQPQLEAGTRRYWQARTGRAVSAEDAREAVANVSAFFDLLATWDKASEPAGPDVPEPGPKQPARPQAGPAEANTR